ncbi:FYN-binding protein 2 isoform X3 [Equus quagga]|uniref:FYN-binding protein 2 isoform X3 n=1 Tax=Equus quagga TaxID=89248 RepID=UPI001EE17848|nr:FYN-binding protein 2 isoform X3 [Equus quagga]
MDGERLRNFKELQAKFQKLDASALPGVIKFPAGVSQKGDIGSTQPTRILANGKPLSSNHNQSPPYCPSGEPQPFKPQKMKLAQRSEIQKCSDSPGPPGSSASSAVNSQKASLLLDVNQSNAEITNEKVMVTSSFRDKLWNWEKVSSQKNDVSSAFLLANCGSRAIHLEKQESMGVAPEEPRKKLETKGAQTLPSQRHLMAQRKSRAASEDPTFLLSQHDKKSLENPSPERSPAESSCQPVYDSELISQAPEKQPDVRHHQLPKTKPLPSVESLGPPPRKPPKPPLVNLQDFQRQRRRRRQTAAAPRTHREATVEEGDLPPGSPKYEDEDKNTKEKEPCELESRKSEKDPPSNHLVKVGAHDGTPGKVQVMKVHSGKRNVQAGKQDAVIDVIQTQACPEDPKLARLSQDHGGYVEALEVTKEIPGQGAFQPNSISEEIYDDVEYPGREGPKSDFANSFASYNEENSEETYEDIYKAKSNYSKIDLDGKEALKRLQRFFKKEKDKFKMRKTKSKENLSAFSISLPDLELRSQEVIIYDDVDINEKESKDEDKLKAWKPKFLIPKEKKEKKGAEESEGLSPRNFFRPKKQNLEKNRMEREEKLFRERFEYDKEITVINTAVACSNNSRNGIFDLPITPGEELEVIDITEENLVICRNSKGKYGYVLIEHLDFKHQGWSP